MNHTDSTRSPFPSVSRRDLLSRTAAGFGIVGLASVCAADQEQQAGSPVRVSSENPLMPKAPHFAARAKHVIFLFMNGGPSHVDTFDPKPELKTQAGQPGPGGN